MLVASALGTEEAWLADVEPGMDMDQRPREMIWWTLESQGSRPAPVTFGT